MQRIIYITIILLSATNLFATQGDAAPISVDDFKFLSGLYTGSLTYTDYQGGEIVSMPLVANLSVKGNQLNFNIEINEGGNRYQQNYHYTVQNGGLKGYEVLENDLKNGKIVFSNKGRDAKRPAEFRHTAVMNEQGLRITKEVRFLDEPGASFFIRNQYTYVHMDAMNTNPDTYAAIDGSDAVTANVNIEAGEEFLLGEYTSGGYTAKLSCQGGQGIEVKVVDKKTEAQTQGFGLDAYGKATVKVRKGEMIILRNTSKSDTTVRVKLSKNVEGMRYREI